MYITYHKSWTSDTLLSLSIARLKAHLGIEAKKKYRCGNIHVIYLQKTLGTRESETINVLRRSIKWRNAMEFRKKWPVLTCLSSNFRANEDKIKILFLCFLVSLINVVWDTIHYQEKGFCWSCNVQNFSSFFKKLSTEKLLAWLLWWFVAGLRPESHYLWQISYLFRMHSIKFLKGPSLTFWQIILPYFQQKNHVSSIR